MGLFSSKTKTTPPRPFRIGDQLPYLEFEEDPQSKFYCTHLLKDGGLGIAWKTPVPPSYSYDDGHLTTINELRTMLESLLPGYEVQVLVTSHNNLAEKMRKFLKSGSGNERAKALRQSRAEKLLEAGFNGYQVSEGGYSMLRDTYMIITMRSADHIEQLGLIGTIMNAMWWVAASILSVVKKDLSHYTGDFLKNMMKEPMAEFQQAIISVESSLSEMFDLERMSLAELKDHYWMAYCPSYREPGQLAMVDKQNPYDEQVMPLPLESSWDIVKFGDDYHGIIMMAMMPDAVAPDYLGIMRRTLPTQYTFFTNFTMANQTIEKVSLSVAAAIRSRIANLFSKEEAQVFQQEVTDAKTRMFQGRKIVYAMVGMIIHGYNKEDVEDRLLRLNANFKKQSVVPDIERTMCTQALSYSFPLAWRNNHTKPFARSRRVLSDDITDLIPVHGHWGGHDNPQTVYVNRDGELTFFDHTSNDFVNWHYAITGTSGSGKSFAVVDLTLQLYAAGIEKQYLLTIKDDYDRFANTMGKLVTIDVDHQDSCINPFAGKMTKQRIQQWATVVELMMQKGGDYETGREEARLIEQVVAFAYEMVPEGDVLRPTWIREAFYKFPYVSEAQRTIGMQDAEELGSFCEDGIYGKLFDRRPSITDDDRIVVFNLMNVLSEKISDVIIYSIFSMLDNVMYMGDRSEKKHLLVDEMISMISSKGGEAVASQLKRAFRTYRSLNCMCGIASQNEEDLTTDVGQAIIGNITKRLMLKPKREMIPMLMESLGMKSDRHEANIRSLETKPGFYSEFYLTSPHGEVICRLLTDKLTYALATTTPDDVVELDRLAQERGGDLWEAAIAFSEEYPHGVRAHKAAIAKQKAMEEKR